MASEIRTSIWNTSARSLPSRASWLGRRYFFSQGRNRVGACIFAQNAEGYETNVRFAVKGTDESTGCPALMDWWCVHFTLTEPQELMIGLWAPEGCNVRRAGICLPEILKE